MTRMREFSRLPGQRVTTTKKYYKIATRGRGIFWGAEELKQLMRGTEYTLMNTAVEYVRAILRCTKSNAKGSRVQNCARRARSKAVRCKEFKRQTLEGTWWYYNNTSCARTSEKMWSPWPIWEMTRQQKLGPGTHRPRVKTNTKVKIVEEFKKRRGHSKAKWNGVKLQWAYSGRHEQKHVLQPGKYEGNQRVYNRCYQAKTEVPTF